MQCAEVRNTAHRTWLRLVGRRHDVQFWDEDLRQPKEPLPGFKRRYKEVNLNTQEKWVATNFEPFRERFLGSVHWYLPKEQLERCRKHPPMQSAVRR